MKESKYSKRQRILLPLAGFLMFLGTISLAFAAYSGERVENLHYELPQIEDPSHNVFCLTPEAVYAVLDDLETAKNLYNSVGIMPADCVVFVPEVLVGDHELSHLYITDEGDMYGILKVFRKETIIWTYAWGGVLVKKGGGDT